MYTCCNRNLILQIDLYQPSLRGRANDSVRCHSHCVTVRHLITFGHTQERLHNTQPVFHSPHTTWDLNRNVLQDETQCNVMLVFGKWKSGLVRSKVSHESDKSLVFAQFKLYA